MRSAEQGSGSSAQRLRMARATRRPLGHCTRCGCAAAQTWGSPASGGGQWSGLGRRPPTADAAHGSYVAGEFAASIAKRGCTVVYGGSLGPDALAGAGSAGAGCR
jgi:hypothetical protein